MMKKIVSVCLLAMAVFMSTATFAQDVKKVSQLSKPNSSAAKIYDPNRDAKSDIGKAVEKAASSNRYVLCQVGGNWCPWCLKFAEFANKDKDVRDLIEKNFVYIHVNYSRENKNPEVMKLLGNPARFGFPVFVILNEKGEPIHIQNSSYLEENKSYSQKKVLEFLANWTPAAVRTLK